MRVGRRAAVVVAATTLFTVLIPGVAFADPPRALPASSAAADGKWQPAFDYDGDGCYPTPAIGPDGTIAPGLNNSGALNGSCHDQFDAVRTLLSDNLDHEALTAAGVPRRDDTQKELGSLARLQWLLVNGAGVAADHATEILASLR